MTIETLTFADARTEHDCYMELLTAAERDVLTLVAEGYGNKQIADRRCVTEQTVKNQVSTIISKLQAQNRTHAAVLALSKGWLRDPAVERESIASVAFAV